MKFKIVKKENLKKIQILFKKIFDRNISIEFYKWRYFDKKSISFINSENKIIFHTGFVEKKINNKKRDLILSRHTSMVDQNFQRQGIYSNFFLDFLKKKNINKKYSAIVTWPNKINLKTFKKVKRKYLYKKLFMYRSFYRSDNNFEIKNFKKIDQIKKIYNFKKIVSKVSLFYKDKNYLIKRYIKDPHQVYYFYPLDFNNNFSIIIFTISLINSKEYVTIQDYFGDSKNFNTSFEIFIKSFIKKKIPLSFWKFWSDKNKPKYLKVFKKHSEDYNLIIIPLRKFNINLNNKKIFMGDTDIFMKLV